MDFKIFNAKLYQIIYRMDVLKQGNNYARCNLYLLSMMHGSPQASFGAPTYKNKFIIYKISKEVSKQRLFEYKQHNVIS